jgi:hypothetical protein
VRRFAIAGVIPNSTAARRGVTSYTFEARGTPRRVATHRSTESSDRLEIPVSLAFVPMEIQGLGEGTLLNRRGNSKRSDA